MTPEEFLMLEAKVLPRRNRMIDQSPSPDSDNRSSIYSSEMLSMSQGTSELRRMQNVKLKAKFADPESMNASITGD